MDLDAGSGLYDDSKRRPRAALGRAAGITALELMVVLAVVGVLLAGAVPSFARVLSGHRAASVVNDLSHAIALTRAEALKRGRRVYLAPDGGRWRDGWVVFVDRNDDRRFDPSSDELIVRHGALPASIAISNSSGSAREPFLDTGAPQRPYVMFDGAGNPRQRNGAFGIGGIVVTDRTGPVTSVRTLCLAAFGRVRIVVDRPRCA